MSVPGTGRSCRRRTWSPSRAARRRFHPLSTTIGPGTQPTAAADVRCHCHGCSGGLGTRPTRVPGPDVALLLSPGPASLETHIRAPAPTGHHVVTTAARLAAAGPAPGP